MHVNDTNVQFQLFFFFFPADRNCNPSLLSIVSNTATPNPTVPPGQIQWWDAQSIVGLIIFILATLYARYDLISLSCFMCECLQHGGVFLSGEPSVPTAFATRR